jgi:DUF3102 family protein
VDERRGPAVGDGGAESRVRVDKNQTDNPYRIADKNSTAQSITELAGSNSLADLAARIKIEHTAVSAALKDSVRHAITAGELLIEAKDQVQHGYWLPWLKDHCTISERTAQLYMRVAKNRAAIEMRMANPQCVADLTLNEAAALLMLTSDVRKLFNFVRDLEHLSGDALIDRCIAEGVAVIKDEDYDPFHGRTETEALEWHLFIIFLSLDIEAGRAGGHPQREADHVEWVLQRPFQNVAEWLGPEGDKFRRDCFYSNPIMPERFKAGWAAFLDERRHWTLADAIKELQRLEQAFDRWLAEGRIAPPLKKKKRQRRS